MIKSCEDLIYNIYITLLEQTPWRKVKGSMVSNEKKEEPPKGILTAMLTGVWPVLQIRTCMSMFLFCLHTCTLHAGNLVLLGYCLTLSS